MCSQKNKSNEGLMIIISCGLIFIVFCVIISFIKQWERQAILNKSQISCLEQYSAKDCQIVEPDIEVWNVCIDNNLPKDCGKAPN